MDKDFLLGYKDTVADEGITLKIDPNDRGGQTWKGISRVMNPNCDIWPLIDAHLKAKHGIAEFKADAELEYSNFITTNSGSSCGSMKSNRCISN